MNTKTKQFITNFGNILYFFLIVNLLFLIGTIIGLIIFGIFPALTATASLIQQRERKTGSLFRSFFHQYKQDFTRANLFFYPFLLFILADIVSLRIAVNQQGVFWIAVSVFVGLVVLFVLALFIFMIYEFHESTKLSESLSHALLSIFIGPRNSFFLVVLTVLLFAAFYLFPYIWPFTGIGLWEWIIFRYSVPFSRLKQFSDQA